MFSRVAVLFPTNFLNCVFSGKSLPAVHDVPVCLGEPDPYRSAGYPADGQVGFNLLKMMIVLWLL